MDSKRITIDIEGKKVTCLFTVKHFPTFAAEIIDGEKMFELCYGKLSLLDSLDLLPAIYYAGYKTYCKLNLRKPKIPFEKFEHFMSSQPIAEGQDYLKKFIQILQSYEQWQTLNLMSF